MASTCAARRPGRKHHRTTLGAPAVYERSQERSTEVLGLRQQKAYDSASLRRGLRTRGITPRIARRWVDSPTKLGRHRWVVERTLSWLLGCRRLGVRYERRAGLLQGLLHLACALICVRVLTAAEVERGNPRLTDGPVTHTRRIHFRWRRRASRQPRRPWNGGWREDQWERSRRRPPVAPRSHGRAPHDRQPPSRRILVPCGTYSTGETSSLHTPAPQHGARHGYSVRTVVRERLDHRRQRRGRDQLRDHLDPIAESFHFGRFR